MSSVYSFLQTAIISIVIVLSTATASHVASASDLRPGADRVRTKLEVEDPATVMAVKRTVRRIRMVYKIDLKKNNYLSPKVARVLERHNHKIRSCYTDRLDAGHNLQGKLALGIRMSKSTGNIERTVRLGGTLRDAPLFRCISEELARLPLHFPKDVRGTLVYRFQSF